MCLAYFFVVNYWERSLLMWFCEKKKERQANKNSDANLHLDIV